MERSLLVKKGRFLPRVRFRVFVLVCIHLICFSFAFAEDKPSDTEKSPKSYSQNPITLDEIIVTATRSERQTKDVPVSATIVTAEEIKANNIVNLDEALKYATGVWNRRMRGMADVGASISIRGIYGSERNLILLDNQPLNSVVWGGVPWSGINIDQVERIEVVRGPFSSLYGINAMGGVVNIITKTPKERILSAEGGYGEDGTTIFRFNYGDRFMDKYSLSIGAERRDTDGYPTFIQSKTATEGTPGPDDLLVGTPETTTDVTGDQTRYIIGDTGDNPTTDWNIYAKGGVEFSDGHSLSLNYTHSEQSDEWDAHRSYLTDQTGRSVHSGTVFFDGKQLSFKEADLVGWIFGGRDNDILAANYVNRINEMFTLKIDAGMNYQFRYYTIPDVWWPAEATYDGGPGSYYEYPSTVYQTSIATEIAFSTDLTGIFGVAYRHDFGEQDVWSLTDWNREGSKIEKTTHIEGTNDYYSLFAQAEWRPIEQISLIPSVRYDYWKTEGETEIENLPKQDFDSKSDSMISPKLSIGYKPWEKTGLRASTGIGYKPPDIDKLYRVLPAGGPDNTPVYPNRDLDPEKVFSWEIGADQILGDDMARISATYFENYITDSLFQMKDSDGATRWFSGAEAEIKGIELELFARPLSWLSLFGNIAWQDSEVTENDADPTLEGNELPFTPEWKWNIGAETRFWKFRWITNLSHVDKVYGRDDNKDEADNVPTGQSEYTVLDTDLHFDVNEHLTASLSVDNVFDEDYYLYWKAPGRTWLLSLRYEF